MKKRKKKNKMTGRNAKDVEKDRAEGNTSKKGFLIRAMKRKGELQL
jgi:hypothetical protein